MISPIIKDVEGNVIQGGISGIPTVLNVAVTAGVWIQVILDAPESKQIILQPRDMVDWKFSASPGGSPYFTFRAGSALKADVVLKNGDIIGYINPTSNTTMEILVGV